MSATVYIFAHQFTAISVPTIDDPAAAAQRLSRMVHHQNFPCPEKVVSTALGGYSTAFLIAHEDASILDTEAINNSMNVDAIARSTGAERYYLIDVHSHDPSVAPVVIPYILRDNVIRSENTGDSLPGFVRQHGNTRDQVSTLDCLNGTIRLICEADIPTYLTTIDFILSGEKEGSARARRLTDMRQSLTLAGD
jgi:hypothetical protein